MPDATDPSEHVEERTDFVKVYSLKTCDTCRKALKALKEAGKDFEVIDVRQDGLKKEDVAKIVEAVGFQKALNRRSTTWRSLDHPEKAELDDVMAVSLITTHPTLLKRPAIIGDGTVTVGWDKESQSIWL